MLVCRTHRQKISKPLNRLFVIMTIMINMGMREMASNLDEVLEKGEEEPEEKIAELLEYIGFIEKEEGKYRLTSIGEKFLKLPVE